MNPDRQRVMEEERRKKRGPERVFVSAGESSGDLYASALVKQLKQQWDDTEWFGCAGPRMRLEGVEAVVDSSSISVAGIVEVIAHIPRIYVEYRKLLAAIEARKPSFLILTDSPDFHLRIARRAAKMGVPVLYLIAPQAWAWRQGRVKGMAATIRHLFCIFPFEEDFYQSRGVNAHYIGHPLARIVKPALSKEEFFRRHNLKTRQVLIALCPGSRRGEMERHLAALVDAVKRIESQIPASFVLATPVGFGEKAGSVFFKERISGSAIQVIEGETWDVLAHADLALAASGTVTMEAALLGTPMITYYKVAGLSWLLGRFLVRVPYYSMVNLIAGRALAPELMQNEMTGHRIADETLRLLGDPQRLHAMRQGLAEVRTKLHSTLDPMEKAAMIIREFFDEYSR